MINRRRKSAKKSEMNNKSIYAKMEWLNTAAFRDLLLIGLIAILAFVFVEALELAETIDKIRQEHEGWPISEIITFPLILSFAFAAYSLRRWKELRYEIAERKQAEKNLMLAYKQLEKSNKEVKEMQIQLVQSEKLASIGQLAAGVAHEINNPLGFITCNFETLENYINKIKQLLEMYNEIIREIQASGENAFSDKAKVIEETKHNVKIGYILENIAGIFNDSNQGLERIKKIVENLREFSRVDRQGSLDKYDINDGIERALIMAKNEIKYSADIRTELSDVPPILCDPAKINQVLLNILLNAAQSIKVQEREDKGTITIRTFRQQDDVVCEISDDGCGISSDTLSRIFDPFFTTKPVGEGTGLGLSVSYDIIVTKHKGKLLVDSTVGKGTKFTIKLPINMKKTGNNSEADKNGKQNSIICGR
jgi:two-component system NtrC family sensor kinase